MGLVAMPYLVPFDNLCFTSPDVCTDGFTVTFWMAIRWPCGPAVVGCIMSNMDDSASDGMQLDCHPSGVDIYVYSGQTSFWTLISVSSGMRNIFKF